MAYKNTAVTVCIFAWDTVNGVGKTGDSANLTLRGVGDGSEYTPSSPSITEVDATNLKGVYKVSLTAGENNYSHVLLGGVSSSTGITIQPIQWTNESDANAAKINSVSTSSVTTVSANIGTTQPVNFTGTGGSALVKGDVVDFGGTAGSFTASGIPDVNTKNINNVSAGSVTVVNANIGTTQPVNFTGTAASALVKGDAIDIEGLDATNQIRDSILTDATRFAGATIAEINANTLGLAIPKNTAYSNFTFKMVKSSDNKTPATGLVVTAAISKDGGAFVALTNAATEISGGWYKIDIIQAETNANEIILSFSGAGANVTAFKIRTNAVN